VVFKLVEKHTSEVDVGVATSRGNIWHNVLYKEWLIELIGVRAISEMESDVIRVLLAITRDSDNDGAWNIDWLSLHSNAGIG
jgi:hypothetical protein